MRVVSCVLWRQWSMYPKKGCVWFRTHGRRTGCHVRLTLSFTSFVVWGVRFPSQDPYVQYGEQRTFKFTVCVPTIFLSLKYGLESTSLVCPRTEFPSRRWKTRLSPRKPERSYRTSPTPLLHAPDTLYETTKEVIHQNDRGGARLGPTFNWQQTTVRWPPPLYTFTVKQSSKPGTLNVH